MPANSVSRETLRDALATGLATVLVGSGLPCDAVYNHMRGDFSGSFVLMVTNYGGGIQRQRGLLDAQWEIGEESGLTLYLHTLVLYSSDDATETTAATWTEAMAEDRLDLIDKIVADYLLDNYGTIAGADYVTYAGPSRIDIVPGPGGQAYWREVTPIKGVKTHA